MERFDLDELDDDSPFEIDRQFCPARAPKPIGCYVAAAHLARRYQEGR